MTASLYQSECRSPLRTVIAVLLTGLFRFGEGAFCTEGLGAGHRTRRRIVPARLVSRSWAPSRLVACRATAAERQHMRWPLEIRVIEAVGGVTGFNQLITFNRI